MFGFFVLSQVPFLWPHLLLWALAIGIGLFLLAAWLNRKARISAVVILFAISAWYCMSYIPDGMKRATNHFGDGVAPEFAFQAVSEGAVPTTATPGQILVIDFFGTWCPPCIAELPEIVRVRAGLQNRRDIEFVVVGTNAGGDTPERLRAFGRRQHVTLPLAFDQGRKAHAAFGLSGFPGIVVIDRAGRVRLTRQGYNRLALVPASPPAGAGTNLPLMKPDDVPPDVPPASLNPEKDPDEWVTKDEPMTGPQRSYLQTLCREAKEEFNENWTKAEASKKIEELQQKTGRGKSGSANT